jgi:hypothetical protein
MTVGLCRLIHAALIFFESLIITKNSNESVICFGAVAHGIQALHDEFASLPPFQSEPPVRHPFALYAEGAHHSVYF